MRLRGGGTLASRRRRGRPDRSWASAAVSLSRAPCIRRRNSRALTTVDANRPRLTTPPTGNRCDNVSVRVRIALFRDAPESHGPIRPFCNAADLLFVATVARLPARHGRQHGVETLCARRRVHDVHREGYDGVSRLPLVDGGFGTNWMLQPARRVKAWKWFLICRPGLTVLYLLHPLGPGFAVQEGGPGLVCPLHSLGPGRNLLESGFGAPLWVSVVKTEGSAVEGKVGSEMCRRCADVG